ncbi:MAG: pyrroloquinoline quinone biosynthesis peptide chaperone PqqD [Pseudomonadota bacterium]
MTLAPDDIPALPRGVRLHQCQVRQGWFLLAPERALKLDQIGVAILGEVDGARSLGAISEGLAKTYNAPVDLIIADVSKFLGDLAARRMVDLRMSDP